MRILITGGAGQLGRALQDAFSEEEVTALGHSTLDITVREQVSDAVGSYRPDVVIHAAAWTDTSGCERDPDRAMLVNAEGAGIVAEACHQAGCAMVYISSNEVFDGDKGAPYAEDDPPHAINVYGASKLEGERRVHAVMEQASIVRTSWLYGPGRESFPEKVLAQSRRAGVLKGVTDEIASPTFTLDLAEALARLVHADATGTLHLTNAGSCSRLEWAAEILRIAGLSVPIEPVTQADFGAPFRKPVDSTLANANAASLGITLRLWQDALAEHLSLTAVRQEAPL
jgi:dTDP-4-dehydrorhamnose reductase